MDQAGIQALIADDSLRRALASDIARELLRAESPLLKPLIKEIVLETIVHYEAVAKIDRCRRIMEMFKGRGFSLFVSDNGRLCYSKGTLPSELKAVYDTYAYELLDYLKDKRAVDRAADTINQHLRNGHK
jgi:hypothetical protein